MIRPSPRENFLDELAADAPVRRMRSRLDGLLAEPPRGSLAWPRRLAWAAAALALLAGLTAVWQRLPGPADRDPRLNAVFELLEAPSTFERLRGVNTAAELAGAFPSLRSALFARVERDGSVNVRLAAIEALLSHDGLGLPESNRLTSLLLAQETAIVQAHLALRLRQRELLSPAELERLLEGRGIHRDAREAIIRSEAS